MGSSARFRYSAYAFVILLGANPALALWRFTKGQREVIAHGAN
jgi:hypothetical protein